MFIKILIVAVVLMILAFLGLMPALLMKKNGQSPAGSCGRSVAGGHHPSGGCCMDRCQGSSV
ncbi:MAG TPA: hypothetical protein ENF21_09735 [Bacteroidetes bacterium]|nr:hypothetical protein [Bacteroidota bacterium]